MVDIEDGFGYNLIMIEKLIEVIKQHRLGLIGLFLFGSRAKGVARDDSDYDLALLEKHPIDKHELFELRKELMAVCNQSVDVVDLRSVDLVFQNQILTTGELLYSIDEDVCHEFKAEKFVEYMDFNYNRAEILKAIRQRGSVFNG